MNKKLNTTLFIIGASLFNIVLMMAFFLLSLALLGKVLSEDTSATVKQISLLLAFLVSIVGTYGIYSLVVKWISKKIDMEKYFHPIFKSRRHKKF